MKKALKPFRRLAARTSSDVTKFETAAAAETALSEWAAKLEGTPSSKPQKKQQQQAPARGDQLVRAVRAVIACPRGQGRDGFISGELQRLLGLALLPESADVLERQLELIRDTSDSKELTDAIVGSVAALARDARSDQLREEVEIADEDDTCLFQVCKSNGSRNSDISLRCFSPLEDARRNCVIVAEAITRIEEVRQLRCLALKQAEMLLEEPRRFASQSIVDAGERQAESERRYSAALESGAGDFTADDMESLALENEVQKLDAHYRELRKQLDAVSAEVDQARARRDEHEAKASACQTQLIEAKAASAESVKKMAVGVEVLQLQRANCSDLLDIVTNAKTTLSSYWSDDAAAVLALTKDSVQGEMDSNESLKALANARLQAAMDRVRLASSEEKRATQTFEICDVEVPQSTLPKLELPNAFQDLLQAWQAYQKLGHELDAGRQAEVDELMREACKALPDAPAAGDGSEEKYIIVLEKTAHLKSFGLNLKVCSRELLVNSIKEDGLVKLHNERVEAAQRVCDGDSIIEVNGFTGDGKTMLGIMQRANIMQLVIRRAKAEAVLPCDDPFLLNPDTPCDDEHE